MTKREFESQLKSYRDQFTGYLHFNVESPKRIQWNIKQAIEFLNSINTDGPIKERIETSVKYLQQASRSATIFGSQMVIDPKGYDLEVTHSNPSYWYQQVIGTAESAMDIVIRYLNGSE